MAQRPPGFFATETPRQRADRFGGRPALRAGWHGRIGWIDEHYLALSLFVDPSESGRARRVATPPNRLSFASCLRVFVFFVVTLSTP
jgi:hypothetical protein